MRLPKTVVELIAFRSMLKNCFTSLADVSSKLSRVKRSPPLSLAAAARIHFLPHPFCLRREQPPSSRFLPKRRRSSQVATFALLAAHTRALAFLRHRSLSPPLLYAIRILRINDSARIKMKKPKLSPSKSYMSFFGLSANDAAYCRSAKLAASC